MVCHGSSARLEAEFPSARSRILKDNYGLCLISQGCGDLLSMVKTAKRFPSSWKVYRRLSPTIKSVHELGIVLDADRGNRWCNRWTSTTKRVN
jgi:hypothetical protein